MPLLLPDFYHVGQLVTNMEHSAPDLLTIVDTEDACIVVFGNDPDDWTVSFRKSPEFPARRWADRMAQLYNARQRTHEQMEKSQ